MNIKREKKEQRPSGMKILNDERIPTVGLPYPVMTSVPLAPTKQVSMSIAKTKTTAKHHQDHYVLQTTKGEHGEEGNDLIDFVLAEKTTPDDGLAVKDGEITEELHLSGDEDDGDEKTEEIVEHVCGKCFKSFRRFSGLKKHLDFCRFDSGYHLRKAEMIKNLDKIEKDGVIMENKDICFCCGESYDTFHLGHINCPDCPKSFKSQMSYERHIFITHSEFNDFPCSICNAKLRSENLLKLHADQHKNRGKPYACKICGKDFTRSYHLKRHTKYSSCSANEQDSMSCKVCNKTFYRLDNLRSHLKQHLGTHVTKKPEYMCPTCKNCFYSLSTLNIHTRTHTGERPFDCDLCEKKFPSLVALKKHRRYHTGEKPYTCSVCSQSFAVKEVLNRHMKRHTGERPHVCSECGKSFIQATQLRNHSKTHIKPFACTDCKEKFKTEKQLERHAKSHNSKSRKRTLPEFRCEICKAAFRKDEQLAKHMENGTHIIPPNKRKRKERTDCAICEKNFDSAKSLQFHILKTHEVDPEEFTNEKELPSSVCIASEVYKLENDTNTTIEYIDETYETGNSISNGNGNGANGGLVVQEFIINEQPATSAKQTIILENEAYTVIPLESGSVIEPVPIKADALSSPSLPSVTPSSPKPYAIEARNGLRRSLAESLAAAIADNDDEQVVEIKSEDDVKLKDNIGKLLDMLVDNSTLKKFGWPHASEEIVLCKVIENCGHDLSKDAGNYRECDYGTRMRDYVKLLFTVVIHNDSIKELLNNYPIDEVIEYVLGNDDDDDDSVDGDDEKLDFTA